jgi:hypothetical protein
MSVAERCLKCESYDHQQHKCTRVLKGSIQLGMEGGRLTGVMQFETNPGLIPAELEADLSEFLVETIPAMIESWPKWGQIFRLHDGKACAAEKPSACVKEYGLRVVTKKSVVDSYDSPEIPGYMKNPGWSGF